MDLFKVEATIVMRDTLRKTGDKVCKEIMASSDKEAVQMFKTSLGWSSPNEVAVGITVEKITNPHIKKLGRNYLGE